MAAWKQILLSLVILTAAAAGWVRFVPGAAETLTAWGVSGDIVAAIAPAGAAEEPAARAAEGGSRQAGRGGRGGQGQTAVVTKPVGQATINDRLQAIGTGRASASATVKPYASGRLTEVVVASGQRVKRGDVLVRLDSDAETIALDRAEIAVRDAQSRLDRVQALQRANTATSVQVIDAQLVLRNAELARRDAQLSLERRTIVAPIDGIIGIIPVEVGNTVTADTAIATIDDRSSLIVDFWVPERFAGQIQVGAGLTAVPVAQPGQTFDGTVSAVDNRLDEASRTLWVKARIPNDDDRLRAGQSFQVTMRFPGDTYPAVDPLAVQWGTDGAFVWTVRDGKGARTPVKIIQRNTENVLVQAELKPDEAVVTQGVYAMREGGPVQVAGDAAVQATPASSTEGTAQPRANAAGTSSL
jgi:RND family efflux transporter MFP subunit